jgi:hypothetical protein
MLVSSMIWPLVSPRQLLRHLFSLFLILSIPPSPLLLRCSRNEELSTLSGTLASVPGRSALTISLDRLFGVTTLDVVRASTFVAETVGDLSKSPEIVVPVVGGHSGVTACSAFRAPYRPCLYA